MHNTAKRLYEAALQIGKVSRPSEVAAFAGVGPQVLNNWETRGVSRDGRLKLFELHGISPEWIEKGTGDMRTSANLQGSPVLALEIGQDPGDGYVQVREYEVRFAAGNGRTAQYDELANSVPRTYRLCWFTQQGINPQHVKCFKVHGSSMEPMLYDGDSVLVNLAETEIVNGRVYAIRYGDELRIKRLYKRLNGTIILHSDNPSHLPRDEELTEAQAATHIAIIGRVRDKSGAGGL